jgi:hypothetical protein
VCASDVTLDPFPFGGGVTLTDSLSCRTSIELQAPAKEQLPSGSCAVANNDSTSKTSTCTPRGPMEIEYIVPFATAPELDSVHRLGAGIAVALNMSSLFNSSRIQCGPRETDGVNNPQETSSSSALGRSLNSRFGHELGPRPRLEHYVECYAKQAIYLAEETSKKFKLSSIQEAQGNSTHTHPPTSDKSSTHTHAKPRSTHIHTISTDVHTMTGSDSSVQRVSERVREVIYDSNHSVIEWQRFLSRISLKVK